jgi:hypothetical protein
VVFVLFVGKFLLLMLTMTTIREEFAGFFAIYVTWEWAGFATIRRGWKPLLGT